MSHLNKPLEYRQIVTRAVCGKGRKFFQNTHTITPPDQISQVLGAWVINHSYDSSKIGETVEIRGSYDVNIWYSNKENTKTDVMKETVHYSSQVPLSFYDPHALETTTSVSAISTQSPNCVEASVSAQQDTVSIRVEKEFVVEIVGETKICVAVFPGELAEGDEKDGLISSVETYDDDSFEDLNPDLSIDDLDD